MGFAQNAILAQRIDMGDRAALFRVADERAHQRQEILQHGHSERIFISLGGPALESDLFSKRRRAIVGFQKRLTDHQYHGHSAGIDYWRDGFHERYSKTLSEILFVSRSCAVCELFHDRNLCDAIQLPRMDMGSLDCDRGICGSDLDRGAFHFQADPW